MKFYPSHRYHPELGSRLVMDEDQEMELGQGWYHSPAEFGVETSPGVMSDPVIAQKKILFEGEKKDDPSLAIVKKPGRPAKPKEGNKA